MWSRDNVKIRGLIGRNLEEQYSRKLAKGSLQEYLKAKILFLLKVLIRALVAHIRTKGAMNCIISSEITDVEAIKKEISRSAFHGWT